MEPIREVIPSIPVLLEEVRRRPGVWLGTRTIHGLCHMLHGIGFAEDFHGVATKARFGGFDFDAFETWVEKKYNPTRLSARSFYLAAHLAGSDAAGFEWWFKGYDEFRRERGLTATGHRKTSTESTEDTESTEGRHA